ncbi:3D domain-containing protein [Leptothermofonsia sp. ETS-13]|uniref:3D domain-containing protein n=1 Tax=Leptothermofonsia sp. ETS-13 TaxID=3035696 RepID=UPI003BA1124D
MQSPLSPITLLPCFLLLPSPTLAAVISQSSPEPFPKHQVKSSVARWQGDWLRIDRVPARGIPLTLWATFYYVHQAQSIPYGLPLLDPTGNPLGPSLSRWDWCHAALQGTVLIHEGRGRSTTYNFAGRSPTPQVDCSPFFSSLSWEAIAKVNRVRFQVATAPYGYGTAGFNLVPYRTVAVDRTQIPLGSVLYIPQARGTTVTLPSGQRAIHDGYFFAADTGSAIHGNHIDVFIGTAERNPFSFITSRSNGIFQAFFIQDTDIAQALQAMHQRR